MRRSTFVGILSVMHATDLLCQCADDEMTLLQLNTRVQAQVSPFAARFPSVTSSPSTSTLHARSLLEAVRQMAHQLTNESPEVAAAAIDSVEGALEQMLPLISDEHDNAQGQIRRQLQEIHACHNSESHGAAVVGNFAEQITVIRACREALGSAEDERQRLCDRWTSHADLVVFPPCLTVSGAEMVYSRAQDLRNWVNDAWPTTEELRSSCQQATEIENSERDRCSPVIADHDAIFCQHYLSCRLLVTCHLHELGVYNTLIATSEAPMASRQDQWRMIKQAQCILGLITEGLGANTTVDDSSLSRCDDEIDVSHLILTFPEPGFWAECPPPVEGDPHCPEEELPEAWTGGSPVLGEELSSLQVRGCPGNHDGLTSGFTAAVRCCSMDGSSCHSGNNQRTYDFMSGGGSVGEACAHGACNGQPDTWCHRGLTLPQATELCAANGERLCTRAEIGSSLCCGTGCSHNDMLIWITETNPEDELFQGTWYMKSDESKSITCEGEILSYVPRRAREARKGTCIRDGTDLIISINGNTFGCAVSADGLSCGDGESAQFRRKSIFCTVPQGTWIADDGSSITCKDEKISEVGPGGWGGGLHLSWLGPSGITTDTSGTCYCNEDNDGFLYLEPGADYWSDIPGLPDDWTDIPNQFFVFRITDGTITWTYPPGARNHAQENGVDVYHRESTGE